MLSESSLAESFYKTWQVGLAAVALVLSVVASVHAILWKRDPRAAIAWMGLAWLVPLGGALLYFVFGVNRLRRQAAFLRGGLERFQVPPAGACVPEELERHLPADSGHLATLSRVVGSVMERPLVAGNRVELLVNGEEAYPAMIEAIRQARRSVSFLIYIFDRDQVGVAFARELGEAARRGVAVRVLIDAAGTRYSFPSDSSWRCSSTTC